MTPTPSGTDSALDFQPPINTQFSVFLDNRVGKLLELVDVFEGQSLHMAALSIIDAADHAVIRLVTSRAELARRLLLRHQLPFGESDILIVGLTPGHDLMLLCKCLAQAELSIHYAYPLMARPQGFPALALHTDDLQLAAQILRRKLFLLLGENDLGENLTPGPPG